MRDTQRPTRTTDEIPIPAEVQKAAAAAAADKQGTLTVLIGTQTGAAFALNAQATLIGRNPRAHVALDDEGISRNHARIFHRDGGYELEDMDSTNGTFLDGVRVEHRTPLQEGARIQIGKTILRFALQDGLEREAARRVYEASVRDVLTGTFNRRYFEERLIGEFAFAVRHGTALCAMLIDVDHFKRINDRWGHPAGDQILRRIGEALRATARVEDVVARYGGEEFAILARGIEPAGAQAFADRVRSVIERASVVWEGQTITATASVGLAHNHAGAAAVDPERLVAAADKALYAAKAAGRNRVEIARSPGRYAVAKPEAEETQPAPEAKQKPWTGATAPRERNTKTGKLPLDRIRRSPKTSKL